MNIEYKLGAGEVLPGGEPRNFNSLKKPLSLKAGRKACR